MRNKFFFGVFAVVVVIFLFFAFFTHVGRAQTVSETRCVGATVSVIDVVTVEQLAEVTEVSHDPTPEVEIGPAVVSQVTVEGVRPVVVEYIAHLREKVAGAHVVEEILDQHIVGMQVDELVLPIGIVHQVGAV